MERGGGARYECQRMDPQDGDSAVFYTPAGSHVEKEVGLSLWIKMMINILHLHPKFGSILPLKILRLRLSQFYYLRAKISAKNITNV